MKNRKLETPDGGWVCATWNDRGFFDWSFFKKDAQVVLFHKDLKSDVDRIIYCNKNFKFDWSFF